MTRKARPVDAYLQDHIKTTLAPWTNQALAPMNMPLPAYGITLRMPKSIDDSYRAKLNSIKYEAAQQGYATQESVGGGFNFVFFLRVIRGACHALLVNKPGDPNVAMQVREWLSEFCPDIFVEDGGTFAAVWASREGPAAAALSLLSGNANSVTNALRWSDVLYQVEEVVTHV